MTCSVPSIIQFNLERKILDNEFPSQIIQGHKSNLPVGATCLRLRKWLFSLPHETAILDSKPVLELIYQQAVADIASKRLNPEDKDGDLRMLKAQKSYREVNEQLSFIDTSLANGYLYITYYRLM